MNRIDLEADWREAWLTRTDGANTFGEKLNQLWLRDRELNAGGSQSSISKNAGSNSLASPNPEHRTTVQMERCRLAAVRLYEAIARDFEYTAPLSEEQELAVYNQGLARFAVATDEVHHDFSFRCSAA